MFYNCCFENFRFIKLKASTSGIKSRIVFRANEETIAEFELPVFVEPEKFKTFELPIINEIIGVHDLTIHLNENINLLSFKFISDENETDPEPLENKVSTDLTV